MEATLLLLGSIIIITMMLNRYIDKLPIPSILIFLLLGMVFGENGLFKIHFDNYQIANDICSFALVFIMFYGGFGTNIREAKPIVPQAVLLSTIGVALTAGITGGIIHYLLGLSWAEALLFGSVIASTDAASVFNLLRTKNLNLKYNSASLLEVESGSNDPMSYMLTVVFVSSILGADISVPLMLVKQIAIGILFGVIIAYSAGALLRKFEFTMAQGGTIFVFGVAILSYALPSMFEGNGYLSAYLAGILLGKMHFPDKKNLTKFFDAITNLSQVMVFFLLGLLVTPLELPSAFIPALVIMIVLTFIARPLSIYGVLKPFGAPLNQIGLMSWAGLRGVASIVFSLYVVLSGIPMTYNIFNIVFCVVLLSMAFQGTFLPYMSHKLNMIDDNADVRKTFNYYQDEIDINFNRVVVGESHPWAHQQIRQIVLPPETLIVLLARNKKEYMAPNGSTEILPNDVLVLASKQFQNKANLSLREMPITDTSELAHHQLKDIGHLKPENSLIVLIQRKGNHIIPTGTTQILPDDILVLAQFDTN